MYSFDKYGRHCFHLFSRQVNRSASYVEEVRSYQYLKPTHYLRNLLFVDKTSLGVCIGIVLM